MSKDINLRIKASISGVKAEEEDANIASGKEAAAEASLVDEDVVMNRMG